MASPDRDFASTANEREDDGTVEDVAPEPGPGLRAFEAMVAGGSVEPVAVTALLSRHPGEHDLILARAHTILGNAFVESVIALLTEVPADDGTVTEDDGTVADDDGTVAEDPVATTDDGTVTEAATTTDDDTVADAATPVTDDAAIADQPTVIDDGTVADEPAVIDDGTVAETAGPVDDGTVADDAATRPRFDVDQDFSAAESTNRGNVRNVVRFDRATHGNFAKRNGELDARRVAAWQADHDLPSTGIVDDDTCDVAEGKPRNKKALEPDISFELRSPVPGAVHMVSGGKLDVDVRVVAQNQVAGAVVNRTVTLTIGIPGQGFHLHRLDFELFGSTAREVRVMDSFPIHGLSQPEFGQITLFEEATGGVTMSTFTVVPEALASVADDLDLATAAAPPDPGE